MLSPKGYRVRNRNFARLHKAKTTQAEATHTDTHNVNNIQQQEVTDTNGGPARGSSAQASSGHHTRREAAGRFAGKQPYYSRYHGGRPRQLGGSGDDPEDEGNEEKPGTTHAHKPYKQQTNICELTFLQNKNHQRSYAYTHKA
jgi:hypothetical protein